MWFAHLSGSELMVTNYLFISFAHQSFYVFNYIDAEVDI